MDTNPFVKVNRALKEVGLSDNLVKKAIETMLEDGVLFSDKDDKNLPATHSVSLTFFTRTPEEWSKAYDFFSSIASDCGRDYESVHLSSVLLDDEEDDSDEQ